MLVAFTPTSHEEFDQWSREDRRVAKRISALIADIFRHPFEGIGKPEPLKHDLSGKWSRRITEEHRLVYYMKDEDTVVIVSCMGHYR